MNITESNIKEFLRENRLTLTWLIDQLGRRGISVKLDHLCRILQFQRNSPFAESVRKNSVEILQNYKEIINAETREKQG